MKLPHRLLCLIAVLGTCLCSNQPTAVGTGGSGTEITNGIVARVYYGPDMSPAVGAQVFLRSQDYLSSKELPADTTTNFTGTLVLQMPDPGSYFIEVSDGAGYRTLYSVSVDPSDTLLILPPHLLEPERTVRMELTDTDSTKQKAVAQVYGLERRVESETGSVAVALPGDSIFTLQVTTDSDTAHLIVGPTDYSLIAVDFSRYQLDSMEVRAFLDACGLQSIPLDSVCTVDRNKRIRTLRLENRGLSVMPPEVGRLLFITYLDLRGNMIGTLPEDFGKLAFLRTLLLDSNPIDTLPSCMKGLRSLNTISLSSTGLKYAGDVPLSHTALRTVFLNDNGYSAIPEWVYALTELANLHLNGNLIDSIPAKIALLSRLSALTVGGNALVFVSDSIGALDSLVNLSLSNNRIDSIPSLGTFRRLRTLDLTNNQLVALPRSIQWCSELQRLKLSGNNLRTLPGTITALQNLIELDVSSNQLCALTPELEAWISLYNPGDYWKHSQVCP